MNNTSLFYNKVPFAEKELSELIDEFEDNGFAGLSNSFERELVKASKNELELIIIHNQIAFTIPSDNLNYNVSALTSMDRVLPRGLFHWEANPMPVIHIKVIVIKTNEKREQDAPEWHKDRQPEIEHHYSSDAFDKESKCKHLGILSSTRGNAKSLFYKVSAVVEIPNNACGEVSLTGETPVNTFVEFPKQRTVQIQLNRIAKSEN